MFTKEEVPELIKENRLWFGKNGRSKPSIKRFITEVQKGIVPTTWWPHTDAGHNDIAKKEIKSLFPEDLPFDTPKPLRLIQRMVDLATDSEDKHIVLDFFAGSGTTGHAIVNNNNTDDGNRQFILVQLPEKTNNDSYPHISDICTERTRRAIKKIKGENTGTGNIDLGFKVFKLDASNFTLWDADRATDAGALEEQLKLYADHIKPERSKQDLLYEILLKSGLPLTAPIETVEVEGLTLHDVNNGELLVCLDDEVTSDRLRAMAARKPRQVICLDAAFRNNDELKTNTVLEMKAGDIVFHTV